MHNQISRKRQDEPCLELGDGKWKIYPVNVAGVNSESLKYENWTEYTVYERRKDELGNEYWANCEVPDWGARAIAELVAASRK
jgi:hypothetical protein